MRGVDREGLRGNTHLFVLSLFEFCVRGFLRHLDLLKLEVHNSTGRDTYLLRHFSSPMFLKSSSPLQVEVYV